MLKCLLFDLDGLLVNSEPLQFQAYQYALAQFDYSLDIETWHQWPTVESSTTRWVKDQGLNIDPEELRAIKKTYYENLIEQELSLKPGVRELLEKCSTEFELAVVSSSRLESIESCLQKFNLHNKFSHFVSGANLKRSKPYPDPYLEALKIMNMLPEHATALEDSVTGLRAATAAGINCVVCPDQFIPKSNDVFVGATLIIESLSELSPEVLRTNHLANN